MNKYFLALILFTPCLAISNNSTNDFSKIINIPFKNEIINNTSKNNLIPINKVNTKKILKIKNTKIDMVMPNIIFNDIGVENQQISNNTLKKINDDFDTFVQRMECIGFIEDKNEIKLFIKYNNILITPKIGSIFEEIYKIKNITSDKIIFLNIKNLSINEYSLPKRTNYEQY